LNTVDVSSMVVDIDGTPAMFKKGWANFFFPHPHLNFCPLLLVAKKKFLGS